MTKLFTQQVGRGPDLVLLHGWAMHSGIWQQLVNRLQTQYRLTIIDLPGHGHSPLLAEQYDLTAVLEQLASVAPQNAYWLGWSLGGALAIAMAHHYPSQVTRLITVASNPKFVASNDWPGMQAQVLDKFGQRLATRYQQTLREFLLLQLMHDAQQKTLYQQLISDLLLEQQAPQGLWPALQLLTTLDLRNELANLTCPSLHVYGALDAIVPAAVAGAIKQLAPNQQTRIINGASHMPFLSAQQQFIQVLQQFLEK